MKSFMRKKIFTIFLLAVMVAALMSPFTVGAESGIKVVFDANGGVCDTESLITGEDGTVGDFPSATREGYIFSGWYTDIDGGEYVFPTRVFDIDTTLFAHWELPSAPFVVSPSEPQIVQAKLGETVSFSIDVKNAESIQWFLNKNDGGDVVAVEGDYFTEMTIENITEEHEGYVYFCEIRNSNMAEEEASVISQSFTIDVEGVERNYDIPDQEPSKEGLSDAAVILLVLAGIVAVSVVAAFIVVKTKKE